MLLGIILGMPVTGANVGADSAVPKPLAMGACAISTPGPRADAVLTLVAMLAGTVARRWPTEGEGARKMPGLPAHWVHSESYLHPSATLVPLQTSHQLRKMKEQIAAHARRMQLADWAVDEVFAPLPCLAALVYTCTQPHELDRFPIISDHGAQYLSLE